MVLLARQLACVAPVSYTVHMARLASTAGVRAGLTFGFGRRAKSLVSQVILFLTVMSKTRGLRHLRASVCVLGICTCC